MTYTNSSHIERVPDDWKLWRYMSFTKFMNLLLTDNLHFHNAAGFTDNFEGTIPEAVKIAMEEEYENSHMNGNFPEDGLELHKKLVKVLRNVTYMSCWHHKGTESAAMWSKYGNHDGAVAIETDVRSLKRALEDTDKQVYLAEVDYHIFKEEYRDEDEEGFPDIDSEKLNPEFLLTRDESHSFAPFLYKRKSFDFEDEVRAIIQEPPYIEDSEAEDRSSIQINTDEGKQYLKLDADPDQSGYDIDIFVDDLINKIHIAPGPHEWVVETIREAVKAKEVLPDDEEEIESFVVESQLDANPVFSADSES